MKQIFNTRPKVGVLVSDLNPGESSYFVVTQLHKDLESKDTIIFFENVSMPCVHPMFAAIQISHAYNFDGKVIATNLSTAQKLLEMPGPSHKYFYLWDLEWLRYPQRNYHDFAKIYRNKELTLICRSQDHADMVELVYNRKPEYVAPFFNLKGIVWNHE